jgi:hypothetical protein
MDSEMAGALQERQKITSKALPFCSLLHHHTLKRPLTPADTKMYRICADQSLRGHFIGREDTERAPSSKVLSACTAQEMEPAAARHVFQYVKGIPITRMRQLTMCESLNNETPLTRSLSVWNRFDVSDNRVSIVSVDVELRRDFAAEGRDFKRACLG